MRFGLGNCVIGGRWAVEVELNDESGCFLVLSVLVAGVFR